MSLLRQIRQTISNTHNVMSLKEETPHRRKACPRSRAVYWANGKTHCDVREGVFEADTVRIFVGDPNGLYTVEELEAVLDIFANKRRPLARREFMRNGGYWSFGGLLYEEEIGTETSTVHPDRVVRTQRFTDPTIWDATNIEHGELQFETKGYRTKRMADVVSEELWREARALAIKHGKTTLTRTAVRRIHVFSVPSYTILKAIAEGDLKASIADHSPVHPAYTVKDADMREYFPLRWRLVS